MGLTPGSRFGIPDWFPRPTFSSLVDYAAQWKHRDQPNYSTRSDVATERWTGRAIELARAGRGGADGARLGKAVLAMGETPVNAGLADRKGCARGLLADLREGRRDRVRVRADATLRLRQGTTNTTVPGASPWLALNYVLV